MAMDRKNIIALALIACVGVPVAYGTWKITSWVNRFVGAIEEGTKAATDNEQAARRAGDTVAKALARRDQAELATLASRKLSARGGAAAVLDHVGREPVTLTMVVRGFVATPEKLLTGLPDLRSTNDAFRTATSPDRAKGLIKGMVGALDTAVFEATAQAKSGAALPLTIVLVREAGQWLLDDVRSGHPTDKDLEPDVSVILGQPVGSLKRLNVP